METKSVIYLRNLFTLLLAALFLSLPGYAKKSRPAAAKAYVVKPIHFKTHKNKNGIRAHAATKHPTGKDRQQWENKTK